MIIFENLLIIFQSNHHSDEERDTDDNRRQFRLRDEEIYSDGGEFTSLKVKP